MNTYTRLLSVEQVTKLRDILEDKDFEFISIAHTLYAAKKPGLLVSTYNKGNKLLVQGKGTKDFVRYILEPDVLGEAVLDYERILMPEQFTPHFGIDESGKGDFFGPLVVAGVYTDETIADRLEDIGVMDSKRITSANKIRQIATLIRSTPAVAYDVVALRPDKYNQVYPTFKNLNFMLAWGHSVVAEELHKQRPDCTRSLSDQFARPYLLETAFKKKNLGLKVDQRTKAESDIAVAAASILARERFLNWMDAASKHVGFHLPLGCSTSVVSAGKKLVATYGREGLKKYAKMHFKTVEQVFLV